LIAFVDESSGSVSAHNAPLQAGEEGETKKAKEGKESTALYF
jgi:hypothetical protein